MTARHRVAHKETTISSALGCMMRPLVLMFSLVAAPLPAAGQARIQTIAPAEGPIAGGTLVTLTGTGFSATSLSLDGAPIAPVSSSDTQISFRTPAHDNGIVTVKVSSAGPSAYAEFLYLPPPLKSLPSGYITTVMGIGVFHPEGRQATSATIDTSAPNGLAVGFDGTVYLSEPNQYVIRRVRSDGVIERYAGTGISGPSGDGGPAIAAQLTHPRGMAIDPAGDIYVADTFDLNSIRKIDAQTGTIRTIAGGAAPGFAGDGGPASLAQLNAPLQVALDREGNIYILECGGLSVCDHPRVRRVNRGGIITTIAGTGARGFSGDGGPATVASFDIGVSDAGGLAADFSGNLYVADTQNERVRKIDSRTGIITTLIANTGPVFSVTADSLSNVYVGINKSNSPLGRILKLTSDGRLLQSWGKGSGFTPDSAPAADAPLCQIQRIALDQAGNILFAEGCSNRIRRINVSTGLLETVAGMGPRIIGDAGPALATTLNDPGVDLLFLSSGELLTAEGSNYRIRKMDRQGNIAPFAGNGFLSEVGFREGPALQTNTYPVGLALAPGDEILIDNTAGISRMTAAGSIRSITKLDNYGFGGDGGPASLGVLDQPWDVAADSAGNLLIADSNNNRIRRIDARSGTISTVAGSGAVNGVENYGAGSTCGDGGPAIQACINTPYGVAIASDGTMYIGENGERIRKVDPNGIITTFLSGRKRGNRLRIGPGGNLFMTPFRIQPNGHAFQFVGSEAGSNPVGLGDGGPASQALTRQGLQAEGIAIDGDGNLYFSDTGNRRIRAIRHGAVIAEPDSRVVASAGTPQIVRIGTAVSIALQITLTSPAGTPENGIRIDFVAPASGASCSFQGESSSISVLTDVDGKASAACVANLQTGSYVVTAAPLALGKSISFSLTNIAPVRRRP